MIKKLVIFYFILFCCFTFNAFSQNEKPKIYIPVNIADNQIKILDPFTFNEIDKIPLVGIDVEEIAFSNDKKLAFASSDPQLGKGLYVIDLIQKKVIKTLFNNEFTTGVYNGPNNSIVVLLAPSKIGIVNSQTLNVERMVSLPQTPYSMAFTKSHLQAYIVTSQSGPFSDGQLLVLDLQSFTITTVISSLPNGLGGINGAILSPDEKFLYVARNNFISVIDTSTFKIVDMLPGTALTLNLQISPDGKTLYAADFGSAGGKLLVIDIKSRTIIKTITMSGAGRYIKLSSDSSVLYISTIQTGLFVFDTKTNSIISSPGKNTSGFYADILIDGSFTNIIPPQINITLPSNGTAIQRNKPYTVKWNTTKGSANIALHKLEISFDGGNTFSTIESNISGTAQEFLWTPTRNANSAQLRITAVDNVARTASSLSGTFSISDNAPPPPMDTQAPTVRFLNPLGGETFAPGDNLMITWSSADNVGVSSQDLSLSTDGGATFPITIANGLTGTTQSFSYSLPSTLQTNSGRLRLVVRDAAGNSAQTVTPANFNVQAPIDTQAPVVTIAQPSNTKNIFSAGQAINVQWQSVDNVAVATQALLLSLDNGQSFQTLSMFDGTTNSFVINNIDKFATQAVIKITATDAAGNKGEKTANFQVAPMLSQAIYTKPLLNITGVGFNNATNNQAGSVRVFINNKEATKGNVTVNSNLSIRVKGNKKKLGLVKGNNSLMLVVNGLNSNSVNFTF